jgi:hypothetical protein
MQLSVFSAMDDLVPVAANPDYLNQPVNAKAVVYR